jgi:hypothetical protein
MDGIRFAISLVLSRLLYCLLRTIHVHACLFALREVMPIALPVDALQTALAINMDSLMGLHLSVWTSVLHLLLVITLQENAFLNALILPLEKIQQDCACKNALLVPSQKHI